jgi:hypothetical protein
LCPNLRSEELALLRGRSDQLAPTLTWSPTYNRLYWNFTKGITAGEVAYAMNYQRFQYTPGLWLRGVGGARRSDVAL